MMTSRRCSFALADCRPRLNDIPFRRRDHAILDLDADLCLMFYEGRVSLQVHNDRLKMNDRLDTLKKAKDRMLEERDTHAKVLAAPFDRDKAERARNKFVESPTQY